MKKTISIIFIALAMQSCATIINGPVTEYQRTKPEEGQPKRAVRPAPLVMDILFFGPVGIVIDFGTCAIYKKEK
jgi:hypothetical protein